MLRVLKLTNVGPAPKMELRAAPRLNIVTGDNGLGKTFLLDVAWWALTATWTGHPAIPLKGDHASIEYWLAKKGTTPLVRSEYRFDHEEWPVSSHRPAVPGIVVYARVDGSFSVWDPARNYWRGSGKGAELEQWLETAVAGPRDWPAAFHFDSRQVWNGLEIAGLNVSEGLERDWIVWQFQYPDRFDAFKAVLAALSPPGELIEPVEPRKVFAVEGRRRPWISQAGIEVPVALASSGVRRILALAYLLVWTWHEHAESARIMRRKPEERVTVLVDEPETHLHPKWQRTIVPALLKAVQGLGAKTDGALQMIVSTHSPLVLASLEPHFDLETDALFHLANDGGKVELTREVWAKQGDASSWLVSDVFGLEQARSKEAEKAIEAAEAFMRGDKPALPTGLKTKAQIHAELQRVLDGMDDFWPRWIVATDALPKKPRAPRKQAS